jgi:hypothetical protein
MSLAPLPGARATVQPTASRKNEESRTARFRSGPTRRVRITLPTVAARPYAGITPERGVSHRSGFPVQCHLHRFVQLVCSCSASGRAVPKRLRAACRNAAHPSGRRHARGRRLRARLGVDAARDGPDLGDAAVGHRRARDARALRRRMAEAARARRLVLQAAMALAGVSRPPGSTPMGAGAVPLPANRFGAPRRATVASER